MSEPEWSLPMNRAELIARCEALEALIDKALNPHSIECAGNKPWPRGIYPGCTCGLTDVLRK